jgi:hypothetical protein
LLPVNEDGGKVAAAGAGLAVSGIPAPTHAPAKQSCCIAAPAHGLLQSSTKSALNDAANALNDAAGAVTSTTNKAVKTISGWFGR